MRNGPQASFWRSAQLISPSCEVQQINICRLGVSDEYLQPAETDSELVFSVRRSAGNG
jgi:hypothetical protein